jgi:hypothetical protein
LLFLMTVGPKGRFDPRRAAEAIHSSANKAGEVGAKAKAGRDMVKPIGEVKAPAGEHSEMSDRTNRLRNDLSSNAYVSYGHQGISDSGASATLEPGRIFERIWPRLCLDAQKAFLDAIDHSTARREPRAGCELVKGWNFALKSARHAHLATVPACGGYQQSVLAMIEGCYKTP